MTAVQEIIEPSWHAKDFHLTMISSSSSGSDVDISVSEKNKQIFVCKTIFFAHNKFWGNCYVLLSLKLAQYFTFTSLTVLGLVVVVWAGRLQLFFLNKTVISFPVI